MFELDLVNRRMAEILPPVFHEEVSLLIETTADCFLKIYDPLEV